MKKILFPLSSTMTGGSYNSLMLIATDNSINKSYDISIVLPDYGEAYQQAKEQVNVDVIKTTNVMKKLHAKISKGTIYKVLYLLSSVRYAFNIYKYLRKEKIDIIHTNDLMSTLYWGSIGKLLKIPVIWHVRQENSSKFLDKIRLLVSDKVIFLCELNLRKFTREQLDSTNYSIIYNSVDVNRFRPKVKAPECVELTRIAFVGFLVERKRPEMFVDAALKIMSSGRRDVEFVIIGEDPNGTGYEKKLKEMIENEGRSEHIKLLGYRSDIENQLQRVDILCLTSKFDGEAFPRVLLEAMSSGCGVITSNCSGSPEIVTHMQDGLIYDANSLSDLVFCLNKLLDDKSLLDEFKVEGRKTVELKFKISDTNDKIKKIYSELI
ncbi:glycosyltransferase family 4 protein [Vibrio crassostreae]|uniref:glycosyltransferase family 4 protein n=1 Tax=Vibrio crassostreae TaxID=246167 RepID=UPI001046DF75|nr:glycosyltransferase family 4 protein [Vibrio crassostreae]TCW16957.1 glycosyltransferase involved in cell wall biosynthesis [Vibrio crassostreae]CAK3666941.1 putative Glycosyltransferase involved in cell wall bisynthesis [Vibrio crassostreae]